MEPVGAALPSGPELADQAAPPPPDLRRRAVVRSVLCSVVGVPLMSYLAYGLARVTVPANETPDPWWIWFSVGTAAVAVGLVVSAVRGRWALARSLAFTLMIPGLAMTMLLIWAMGLGLVFLPGALVWIPVLATCLRLHSDQVAAATG